MKSSRRPSSTLIEVLEDRRLLSITPIGGAALLPTTPIITAPVVPTSPVLGGRSVLAEANEPFQAVIGSFSALPVLTIDYTFAGSIDWGDGTPATPATFFRQGNGTIDILGSHTYTSTGNNNITITLFQSPPSDTAAPIISVGTIDSTATVVSSPGGVTLEKSAGVRFDAAVGSFTSSISDLRMLATIDWGDGTVSVGKIVALPVAAGSTLGGGRFEVVGTHTYAQTGSYAVNVTVTASPVLDPPNPTPDFSVLVAQIESVADVLPTPATVLPITPIVLPGSTGGASDVAELLLDRM
jgi:hypothetical protein